MGKIVKKPKVKKLKSNKVELKKNTAKITDCPIIAVNRQLKRNVLPTYKDVLLQILFMEMF